MLVASFIDKEWVAPGIVAGWVAFIFILRVAGVGRRRPLGIWLVAGILFLLPAMAFTDWLIDDAF